jgi:hypothetical protein
MVNCYQTVNTSNAAIILCTTILASNLIAAEISNQISNLHFIRQMSLFAAQYLLKGPRAKPRTNPDHSRPGFPGKREAGPFRTCLLGNVHFKLIQGTQTTEHKLTQGNNMLTHTQDEVSASACIMTAYAVRLN